MQSEVLLRLISLLLVVVAPVFVGSANAPLNDDVLGLIVFKADIEDPKGKLSSWDEDDENPCNWDGVGCSMKSRRVTELNFDGFGLSGHVGRGLSQLEFLRKVSLARNNLTGSIGPSIARIENLRLLDLSENGFEGEVPNELFRHCGGLREVSLAKNRFSGEVPESLSSCSSLVSVNLSSNQFSGSFPIGVWSLKGLKSLDLSDNVLEGEVSEGVGGLSNLRTLDLRRNKFSGVLSGGIGSSLMMEFIDVSENSFTGNFPKAIQKLGSLSYLNLGRNSFQGEVPDWIRDLKSIQTLDLSGNKFSGQVPASIGNLHSLKELNLSKNSFTGRLPTLMFNIQNLVTLDLSGNALTGYIPPSVGQVKSLGILDLSKNGLNGSIPAEIGGATSLRVLRLKQNFLTGNIPITIQNCFQLTLLDLSENNLTGTIPLAIAVLNNLQYVDFSLNKLTGNLPRQLANLTRIVSFNISHNNIQGELPSGGFFNIISPSSVSGNPALCGSAINKSCSSVFPKPFVLDPNSSSGSAPGSLPPHLDHRRKALSISAVIAIIAATVIFVGVIAITVLNLHVRAATSKPAPAPTFSAGDDFSHSSTTDANSGKLVMFSGEPDFSTGAHALLNKDCELGRGGFGAVYQTVLSDGRSVAIKKLTVSSLVKSQEDFEREVEKLATLRHPNLVALEGYYWTTSLQLLIYEYVSGGSLYKNLHEVAGNNFLSWNERFNIILGTAKSLAHLHSSNIIHYNLKSSNVLIDDSGEAKVGDYGLARLLPMLDRYVLSSKIQSALGYMAPEFACRTVKITEKCDVYGFGVLVLEVVTGKRPVEYMEDDVMVLCEMVRGAVEEGRVEECVDPKLEGTFPAKETIPVIKLGLICTSQVPSNRPDMGEVVNILDLIRCPSEGRDEFI